MSSINTLNQFLLRRIANLSPANINLRGGGTGLADQAAAGPIIISKSQVQIKIND